MDTARFWSLVDKSGECWLWQGRTNNDGYGRLNVSKRQQVYAHRYAYANIYGPIPDGFFVCHHCDNPRCVRPDHLFLGTNQDNVNDMVRKGRHWAPPRKTHCPKGHAYTPENTEIRKNGQQRCRICAREEAKANYRSNIDQKRAQARERMRQKRLAYRAATRIDQAATSWPEGNVR